MRSGSSVGAEFPLISRPGIGATLDTGCYKVNGKTVNVKLSPEAAPLFKAAAQQYRKLKTLLNRLDKLSKTILRQQAKLADRKSVV